MVIHSADSSVSWDTQVSLKRLAESVPAAVVIVDRSGQIVYVNRRLEELFGYEQDELLGSLVEVLIPDRYGRIHVQHRRNFAADPHTRTMGSGMDLAGRKKDGSEFPIEVGLSYLPAGEDMLVIATITDISKRKLIEETLEQRVAERTEEIERRRKLASGLGTILEILNSNRALSDILEFIVAHARRLLLADACCVYIREERTGKLAIQANDGLTASEIEELENVLNQADSRGGLSCEQPLFVGDNDAGLSILDVRLPEELREHIYLPVSLRDKGEIYGILLLRYPRAQNPSPYEVELARTMGNQTALAIANARLHEQIVRTAMAAERNRIGRDLHDAVTQTLFSASMIADVLPVIWRRDEEEGQKRLAELSVLTRGALAEMRTLLLELRPTKLIEVDISELIRQLAEATAGRARVPVSVEIEGDADVPTDVKIAVYRIAQESLNNVAKHARAQRAFVHLLRTPDLVELIVADDGCGFDFTRIAPEHLGLGIMRERADAINATLEVQSKRGEGTTITVRWTKSGRSE